MALCTCTLPTAGCPAEAPTECASAPAADEESFLGLDEALLTALVDARAPIAGGEGRCAGFFVQPDVVLTALHCRDLFEADDANVAAANGAAMTVLSSVPHPTLDLLLLDVTATAAGALDEMVPFALAAPLADEQLLGARVELTGTSRGGGRFFDVLDVIGVNASTLVVNGPVGTGACDGDSGGPLLWRGPDGAVEAIGVLSSGSPGCQGRDTFVRLDNLAPGFLPGQAPVAQPCGGLSDVGRCYDQTAAWCEEGAPAAATCDRCGWREGQGFRCLLAEEADACEGLSDLGTCEAGVARWCQDGAQQEQDCVPCGCQVLPATGRARCGVPVP